MFILRVVDCSIAYYTNIIPAFNPKTLRIAELRKILIFHEIDFVTGAKKGDLVEAFQRGIVPQRAKLLLEVTNATSPSATRSSNPIENASLASSTRRRSRLNDESPPARKTRQQQQLDSAIFDDESKPAKISPNRRRHRSLAKPFVDPGNIEDNATPVSEEKVTPVKTITPRPNRRRSSSFSKSAHKELNLDHLSSSAEKKLDSDAKTTSSEAERRERIDKSPFSNVNFFQSASPDPKPVIKKEKRKRQYDDEPYSARKKRELEESIKQESFATPTKASHRQANATSSISKTDYNKEHDTTLHTAAEGRTPKRSSELKQPPHTDPGKGSARSTGFVDATYSVGKKQPGLFHPGTGRKLSFMPDVDQLNVSKEFSKQLINSSPIKHEKKLDTAKNEKIDISEEEDIEIPSDDDEVDLSEEKEDSSELSSSEQGDDEDDVDQSETTPDKFSLTQIVGVLLFFILGTALARWWIIERINAGYCDVGFVNWKPHYSHFTPTKMSDYFDPEYFRDRGSQVLDYIRPGCQNCPAHAQCYRGFKAVCDPGFVKKQSILGHFLPIRPTCEPDTQKQRRVKAIANKALEILGQRNVDFQCGKYKGENGLDARELHDAIHKLTSATLDEDEFQDLWTSAVADIENHDDITVSATTLWISF